MVGMEKQRIIQANYYWGAYSCQTKPPTKRRQVNQTGEKNPLSRKRLLKAGPKPGFSLERMLSKGNFDILYEIVAFRFKFEIKGDKP